MSNIWCVWVVTLLQEKWEELSAKLSQTHQQIQACETTMVFSFVEVKIFNISSSLIGSLSVKQPIT